MACFVHSSTGLYLPQQPQQRRPPQQSPHQQQQQQQQTPQQQPPQQAQRARTMFGCLMLPSRSASLMRSTMALRLTSLMSPAAGREQGPGERSGHGQRQARGERSGQQGRRAGGKVESSAAQVLWSTVTWHWRLSLGGMLLLQVPSHFHLPSATHACTHLRQRRGRG
jgi:hypothetical protein